MIEVSTQGWSYNEIILMSILFSLLLLAFITVIAPFVYREIFRKRK